MDEHRERWTRTGSHGALRRAPGIGAQGQPGNTTVNARRELASAAVMFGAGFVRSRAVPVRLAQVRAVVSGSAGHLPVATGRAATHPDALCAHGRRVAHGPHEPGRSLCKPDRPRESPIRFAQAPALSFGPRPAASLGEHARRGNRPIDGVMAGAKAYAAARARAVSVAASSPNVCASRSSRRTTLSPANTPLSSCSRSTSCPPCNDSEVPPSKSGVPADSV